MRTIFSLFVGWLVFAPSIVSATSPSPKHAHPARTLRGLTVVLDPGHGGSDSGTARLFGHDRIEEDQLTLGFCQSLAKRITQSGGRVIWTVNPQPASQTIQFGRTRIPAHGAQTFQTFGQPAIDAQKRSLATRLDIANRAYRHRGQKRIVFLVVHFDHVGSRPDISGMRIICPRDQVHSPLITSLTTSAMQAQVLRQEAPVVANGDRSCGIRNLMLLLRPVQGDPKKYWHGRRLVTWNPAAAYLEVANLASPHDWWRVRQQNTMLNFVDAVHHGLEMYAHSAPPPATK